VEEREEELSDSLGFGIRQGNPCYFQTYNANTPAECDKEDEIQGMLNVRETLGFGNA
jgi:hypothetical protein